MGAAAADEATSGDVRQSHDSDFGFDDSFVFPDIASGTARNPNWHQNRFITGTLQWLDDFIIGERMCPWAAHARSTTRIVVIGHDCESLKDAIDTVLAEASVLGPDLATMRASLTGSEQVGNGSSVNKHTSSNVWSTTLLVFSDRRFSGTQGLAAFVKLWTAAQAALHEDSEDLTGTGSGDQALRGTIDLLAFHPDRVDRGPGCSGDPRDPGHFSTRSPFPLLQLLRAADLAAARSQWAARHGGPGALSLLLQNKDRLRDLGHAALASRLACWQGQHDETGAYKAHR